MAVHKERAFEQEICTLAQAPELGRGAPRG